MSTLPHMKHGEREETEKAYALTFAAENLARLAHFRVLLLLGRLQRREWNNVEELVSARGHMKSVKGVLQQCTFSGCDGQTSREIYSSHAFHVYKSAARSPDNNCR